MPRTWGNLQQSLELTAGAWNDRLTLPKMVRPFSSGACERLSLYPLNTTKSLAAETPTVSVRVFSGEQGVFAGASHVRRASVAE
jgi:hypothetical protein